MWLVQRTHNSSTQLFGSLLALRLMCNRWCRFRAVGHTKGSYYPRPRRACQFGQQRQPPRTHGAGICRRINGWSFTACSWCCTCRVFAPTDLPSRQPGYCNEPQWVAHTRRHTYVTNEYTHTYCSHAHVLQPRLYTGTRIAATNVYRHTYCIHA